MNFGMSRRDVLEENIRVCREFSRVVAVEVEAFLLPDDGEVCE